MSASNSYPRLIEVALPIREISAESGRDKSIRHGHISTLHLWWARRPLAAARAVTFATLVPDPDHPDCPPGFRQAVDRLLRTSVPTELRFRRVGKQMVRDADPYSPYEGIEDTPRARLLAFIAKWSHEYLAFERGLLDTAPKPDKLLDDRSLAKWETSDPENAQGLAVLAIARELVKAANSGEKPRVFDPFSGGGAIPLESGRVGAIPIANDYNPVAFVTLKATCEFPQAFGKPGERPTSVRHLAGDRTELATVPNVLANDVERWATIAMERLAARLAPRYPVGKDGRPSLVYIWARTVTCQNPSCRASIPMLSSLLLSNRDSRRVALALAVQGKTISFELVRGSRIESTDGTMQNRGNVRCPCCGQTTRVADVRREGQEGRLGQRLVAVIVQGKEGKDYRLPEPQDEEAFAIATTDARSLPSMPEPVSSEHRPTLYGFNTHGALFNPRQRIAMHEFGLVVHDLRTELFKNIADPELAKAVYTYLCLWLSRTSMFMTSFGLWKSAGEFVASPFGVQRIAMVWDYAEVPLLSESTGGAPNQLDWILRVIRRESSADAVPARVTRGDSSHMSDRDGFIDAVVTDPPYFDEMAYADLSDSFYVWLKQSLSEDYPEQFATPLTPKTDEATALAERHGSKREADAHFRRKLTECFAEAKRLLKPGGVISVMFAHQTTQAWDALVNSLFSAGLNIDATWPIDTERSTRVVALDASALASSITVVCRSRVAGAVGDFKEVRLQVEKAVRESVKRFWSFGLRGADLIVACYGPAVGVFGRYERVERRDGTPVLVPELLQLAKAAARDAIAGEFRGDNLSTLYYVWATLYGAAQQEWDDARLVVQIGGDADNAMEVARNQGLFVVDGASCRLALLADRQHRRGLGADTSPPLIDALHRAMLLWKQEKRADLVGYLSDRGLLEDGPLWKLAQALFEVLGRDTEDWKLVSTLLGERGTLRTEGMRTAAQTRLFGGNS